MASKSYYEAECDRVFSIVLRQKGMDFEGIVKCCTCPKRMHWSLMTAGHYRKRRHLGTRWEITNGGPQCAECNGRDKEDEMEPYLISLYGEQIIQKLILQSLKQVHPTIDDLKRNIERFTDMIIAA